MKSTYEKEKIVSIVIIAISLLVMAGIAAFLFLKPEKPTVTDEIEIMPNIVGYSYKEVEACYSRYFSLAVTDTEYSDEFLEGAILSQDILPGKEYLKGQTTVNVTVSKGAKPAETAAPVTEPPAETTAEETEPVLTDGEIENPHAAFEDTFPASELDITVHDIDIPDGRGKEITEELYAIMRRRGADAGFLYYDPETGGSIEYNADEKFSAGSIIKAVYARSLLGAEIDLSEQYEMTEELLNSQYELVNGKPVGTKFTVEELIRAAIIDSDNTAYKMLYNYIGYKDFNEYAASLGVSIRMTDENYWFRLTPRQSAIFFKEIYYFTKQHTNGKFMLDCMSNTTYREMFSVALPDKTVAEKYGYLPQEDFYTLGDCAIVLGDKPYVLVAYVRGTGSNLNTQFFRDTAALVDELHELLH
ncbi:MAG: serine hydrolase [Oscillospiraceae bacterium]|nr:serine hydrolase [Oscillospiraceae bacterium]